MTRSGSGPDGLDTIVDELVRVWTRETRRDRGRVLVVRAETPELARLLDDLVDGHALDEWRTP